MALILVAEDDHFFSSLICTRLLEGGLKVLCAYDGDEAVSLAQSKHPDLLLLDILMPKKDGYAVMEELRSVAETARIPVLVASNLSDNDAVERCKKLGAADFLVKASMTPAEIAQRVAALLPK